jgi:hypothetical protein
MATAQDWAYLCIGVLAFIFSFVSYYRYTVPNDPSFSGEATAWHGFFGWFAVVLALSGSAFAARQLFSTRATAGVGTARAMLVLYGIAVGCVVLSLLFVPADPSNTYGLSPDRGHGTGYWVSLVLLLAGLALSFGRYRRLAGTPSTTVQTVTG